MSNYPPYPPQDAYDEEDAEYLDKVPTRYQELTHAPKSEHMIRPWINGWD